MSKDKVIDKQSRKKKKSSDEAPLTAREEWTDFFRTAVIAVILALVIRTFLFEPFNIPSGSMKPTLEVGDYLFVYKPAYGYSRHSFPMSFAPIDGRVMVGDNMPQRGDVIVFKLPTNPSIDYIKRIVGMPGETIQVIDGELYIDDLKADREPVGLKEISENGINSTVMEYIQTLPGDIMFRIYEERDDAILDNTEEYVVPEGHYFVMGDNRDNSQDSRVVNLVGFVPFENIVGRASFLFFSTNGKARLHEIWKWPMSIRYDRLFKGLSPIRPEQGQEHSATAE